MIRECESGLKSRDCDQVQSPSRFMVRFSIEHDLCANALLVCRAGKQLTTLRLNAALALRIML
jgi:hypothetical protein